MSRYWLIKVPDRDCDAFAAIVKDAHFAKANFEIVEIIPEKRDANWMETALAAKLAVEETK